MRLALVPVLVGVLLPASPLRPGAPEQAPNAFDDLVRRADEAREGGRLEEAEGLYREALKQRPRWSDGWWYLGTMAYERDRPLECIQAFRRLLALKPEAAPAWALRGLCAFQLKEYAAAHVRRAVSRDVTLPTFEKFVETTRGAALS